VHIQDLSPEIAKAFNYNMSGGALIGDVSPNTPASKAGLQKGDVIVKLNGQAVSDYVDLRLRISQMAPGTSVKLDVWRDGKTQDYTVALGELPEKAAAEDTSSTDSSGGLEGVEVDELTPEIAQQLNLGAGVHGVVVTAVDPSSPAAAAQPPIGRGDVIQEINHKPIRNVSDYRQAIAGAGSQPVLLLVNHGGVTGYSVVQPH
jgi:serine protease Do